ncbi:MAG: cyclic nucleotide-binding domain-containing protein [Acidobacteria bacterium]|nr:cyclic nucleotide-binding domain-containing protein [Acidobacteriota bacterium]
MAEMTLIEKVLFLQEVELLSSLSPEQLARIGLITREMEAAPGQVLFREKTLSDSVYIIVRGEVAIQLSGESFHIASEKDVVGTWALIDDEPMAVTASVKEEAHLLQIKREDFFDLLADHSEIMQNIFHILVRRIRRLIEE